MGPFVHTFLADVPIVSGQLTKFVYKFWPELYKYKNDSLGGRLMVSFHLGDHSLTHFLGGLTNYCCNASNALGFHSRSITAAHI